MRPLFVVLSAEGVARVELLGESTGHGVIPDFGGGAGEPLVRPDAFASWPSLSEDAAREVRVLDALVLGAGADGLAYSALEVVE